MKKKIHLKLCALAAMSVVSASASAAVVNGSFAISSSTLADLWSITLDGALQNTGCTALNPADTQRCQFFGGTAGTGRKVVINQNNNFGPGSGTLDVQYDNATGEIIQVNKLRINYPDAVLVITGTAFGSGTVTIAQGNGLPTPFPGNNDILFTEAGTGTLNRIIDPATSMTTKGLGTVDPDQGVAIGQAGIFQHNDQLSEDAPDFSVFTDVVDSCVPVGSSAICFLIPGLRLDGVRYRIDGTVSATGGNTFALEAQTSNNSLLFSSFTTAVPAPGAVWLLLTGVAALGGRAGLRRRARG